MPQSPFVVSVSGGPLKKCHLLPLLSQALRRHGGAGRVQTGRPMSRGTTARSAVWPCSCVAGLAEGLISMLNPSWSLWSRRASGRERLPLPSLTWTSAGRFRFFIKELPQRKVHDWTGETLSSPANDWGPSQEPPITPIPSFQSCDCPGALKGKISIELQHRPVIFLWIFRLQERKTKMWNKMQVYTHMQHLRQYFNHLKQREILKRLAWKNT